VVGVGSIVGLSNEGAIYAFLDRVVNRFGALIEIFINQNEKFRGEFQKLCEKTLIDHRTTLQDHFEANGLTKWMV
jgi:hypothetical protein